ncbi:MAG: hypothetical protein M3220_10435 [Chloroflexota bacterium]|nr:hypothetical protein [Chloroflexota bacterium]
MLDSESRGARWLATGQNLLDEAALSARRGNLLDRTGGAEVTARIGGSTTFGANKLRAGDELDILIEVLPQQSFLQLA